MIELADIRVLIGRMLRRDELLATTRSAIGAQLERMASADRCCRRGPRAAEKAGWLWQRADTADRMHAEFAYYCHLAKQFNDEQYRVLEALNTPATPDELAARMPYGETNERVRAVWIGDLVFERVRGELSQYRTEAGEEVLWAPPNYECPGVALCPRDDCAHDPQRVLVRGPVPKLRTQTEAAAHLGISVRQVRRRSEESIRITKLWLEDQALRQFGADVDAA